MSIKIEVVKTKEDFNEFYKLPWKVYKNDAYWVPPLFSDIRDMFDKNKNPLFHHAQVESFIAKRDGEVVGRISAIIDENSNKFHNEKTGFFGFFEVIEDYEVAVALFDKAKEWCKAKDMKIFRGPTNFTTNDECAFLLEGFDSSPMIMMTYNPKYYLDFAEKYGFKKAKDLYAFYRYAKDGIPERILKLAEQIGRAHV